MARKILLADDSVTAQNMGRKILADAGYEVLAVNNGSAALKKIGELRPDLVILDVYMPGYSGLEVCQRLKEAQETARIPVLLSVGKLEPFKPEEAQRVRADGYIVKPFEASELLSALSKLEDKVVPRAEPSKPGRFARAIAAAEESARDSEKTGEKNGWKNRIGFPQEKEKTEPAERVADEASTYSPMNRDQGAGDQEAAKANVDVGALVPEGVPKDVTAEEVAAIAAAAAQIQRAEAAARNESRPELPTAEFQVTNPPSGPAAAAESEQFPSPEAHSEGAPALVERQAPASHGETVENSTHHAVAEAVAERDSSERREQPQDEPVTMAAGTESATENPGASRWTAVPVALEGEEATLSLEQEMQKVYASFEVGDKESGAETVGEERETADEMSSADSAQAEVNAAIRTSSDGGIQAVVGEPIVSVEAAEPEPAMPPEAEVASASVPAFSSSGNEEGTPSSVQTEGSPIPQFEESDKAMPVAEFLSPVSEAEVAGLAGLVGLSAESQLAAEVESVTAVPTAATSKPFTRLVGETESRTLPEEPPRPEQEEVKNTAAAWASWRQIRDTGNGGEGPEQTQSEGSQSRAVAAGAEQITQETESKENPADVASIVDSVLADLRPKLMAEISRKMAEKK